VHEPLLERIRQLERSVLRWQLACLALVIVVVALLAIGGTFGAIMLLRQPDIELLRAEADAARQDAVQAMQQERAARHEAERALQAERAARKQIEGK
jgi:hypothetical protein